MAGGDTVSLAGGDFLVGKLVEIDSTVAIAGNIALELVSATKAKWQDCALVDTADTGDTGDIRFVHKAAVGNLWAMLAAD